MKNTKKKKYIDYDVDYVYSTSKVDKTHSVSVKLTTKKKEHIEAIVPWIVNYMKVLPDFIVAVHKEELKKRNKKK